MQSLIETIESNVGIIVFVVLGLLLIAIIFIVVLNARMNKLKEKYDYFLGNKNDDKIGVPIEVLLNQYIAETRKVEQGYIQLTKNYEQQQKQLSLCLQKVGVVRYNPFDEMGGDQCFAVALLDENDNGVVLNGIHSRSSSYTYGKPIQSGKSTYNLSAEEIQAIDIARKTIR